MVATRLGSLIDVKLLIKLNANIDIQNPAGDTAFHIAHHYRKYHLLPYLKDASYKKNRRGHNDSNKNGRKKKNTWNKDRKIEDGDKGTIQKINEQKNSNSTSTRVNESKNTKNCDLTITTQIQNKNGMKKKRNNKKEIKMMDDTRQKDDSIKNYNKGSSEKFLSHKKKYFWRKKGEEMIG